MQPQQIPRINWANPITQSLSLACVPGLQFDAAKNLSARLQNGAKVRGGTLIVDGTTALSGLVLAAYPFGWVGPRPLLGALANSTLLTLVTSRTTGGGANGDTSYCERALGGGDIYKIGTNGSGPINIEFTYRNDAGTLLQLRCVDDTIGNGKPHVLMMTKDGTAHAVYSSSADSNSSNTGTFGSASTAFTETDMYRFVGSDANDTSSIWQGEIDLVLGWDRTLRAEEIRSVQQNPWQVFAPGPGFRAFQTILDTLMGQACL